MDDVLNNTRAVLDKKERKQFAFLLAAGIIISIADILALIALLWVVNFYIQPAGSNSLSFLPGWLSDHDSIGLIAVFGILFAVKNIAGYFVAKAQYAFTGKVAVRVSLNNLANYQRSSFTDFVNTDSSALIRKIAIQPFEFSQHVLSGLQQIITQLFLVTGSILAILLFNAKLFLLLLAILLPPVIVIFFFIRKRLVVTRKQLKQSNERSYQYLLDALKAYVEGNIYQRNDFFLRRFLEYRRQFSASLFNSLSLQNLPARVIEIFAVMGLFILIVIAKWSDAGDRNFLLTIGAFIAAAYKIIPGMVKLINYWGQIKAYEFDADEMIATDPMHMQAGTRPVTLRSVAFDQLGFQYHGKTVLHNISFFIQGGELLGIRGESGIGKTTLLNLLLGFVPPSSGEIRINGVPLDSKELKKYWPSIAYTRQQSFFIYDTILRNITLEEQCADPSRLRLALEISGLGKLVDTFPEGLEKMITENGKNISGGQQQRIAIARAVYKDASLIILDEPFNELDEGSSREILRQLKELCKSGKIIILVTHDQKSLEACTKILSLDE